ncbi:MAG TPA: TonB family protein [Candidatus Baltobacteraceae bacterium]|jgi:TonB family protein
MAQKKPAAPDPKQPPNTVRNVLAYSRRFIFYGFVISVLLHGLFGPFVEWKPSNGGTPEPIQTVSVTKLQTPRPTPPPTPTPTPPPKQTPQPTQPPHVVTKLRVQPPKTHSNSNSGPSENAYTNTQGSESGVPQGNANTGPPAPTAGPATATAAPTPTKPACAVPNAAARATQKVVPDMPEIARQMGASGTAQVKVTLDANGNVTAATIATSTHNSALDKAAVQAAQQSKYQPDIVNCVPTPGSYLYVVTFETQ